MRRSLLLHLAVGAALAVTTVIASFALWLHDPFTFGREFDFALFGLLVVALAGSACGYLVLLVRRGVAGEAGVGRTDYVLAAALIASLVGNVFFLREWSREKAQVPYNQLFEGPLIDEAIKLYSAEIGVSPEEAMRNRFPVAMTVPDAGSPGGQMRCVSLDLPEGWLGFEPVYCFVVDGESVRLKNQAKF